MTFKVEWCEVKTTSTGKPYTKMTLKDETDAVFTEVSIWSDNPQYDKATPGGTLEGEITTNEKGYKSFKAPAGNLARRGFTKPDIAKAQERKEGMIDKAMTRKEDSFETSATFRDATLITLAQLTGKNFTNEEFATKWKAWRKWLITNYSDKGIKEDLLADNLDF